MNRQIKLGEEAKSFYLEQTKANTGEETYSGFENRSELAGIGGYWKEDEIFIAYDFTNGDEVFIEEFTDLIEAIKYASGIIAKTKDGYSI